MVPYGSVATPQRIVALSPIHSSGTDHCEIGGHEQCATRDSQKGPAKVSPNYPRRDLHELLRGHAALDVYDLDYAWFPRIMLDAPTGTSSCRPCDPVAKQLDKLWDQRQVVVPRLSIPTLGDEQSDDDAVVSLKRRKFHDGN